jgi:ubiquinone/menaquinone biosynthesis C-methylase UbiE
MKVEQEAVQSILRAERPHRVLDVGTGTGRNLRLLANLGAPVVIGLDLNRAMLSNARAVGAPLVQGDASRLPVAEGAFDAIVASLMVGDIENLRPWAEEAYRALEPSGFLVYSDFHPSWSERNWQRTFRTESGRARRVRYYPHTLQAHRNTLRSAGFRVTRIIEPRIEREPVLVVVCAHKC